MLLGWEFDARKRSFLEWIDYIIPRERLEELAGKLDTTWDELDDDGKKEIYFCSDLHEEFSILNDDQAAPRGKVIIGKMLRTISSDDYDPTLQKTSMREIDNVLRDFDDGCDFDLDDAAIYTGTMQS